MKRNEMIATILPLAALGALVWGTLAGTISLPAQGAGDEAAGPRPVEESMHEFMEYVFEPGYKRLKANLAAAPASNAEWKAVKADALLLAEATNLLWLRVPEEKSADWKQIAAAVRQAGGSLYQSAGDKDFAAATEQYQAMLQQCNRCHQQFAEDN